MFMGERFARDQAIGIARDRVSLLPAKARQDGLRLIELALERWKRSHAGPDGKVPIRSATDTGLFAATAGTTPLHALAAVGTPQEVPVQSVSPERFAGLESAADLLAKLVREKDKFVADLPALLQGSAGIALLVERDGDRMPISALAFHVRMLWVEVWETLKIYKEALVETSASEEQKSQQLAGARVQATIAKMRRAEERKQIIFKMGVEYFVKNPLSNSDEAAAHIFNIVKQNDWTDCKGLSLRGIKDRLAGAKKAALVGSARHARRS